MIQELERKQYKPNAGNKYHIDCKYLEENTNQIQITKLIRNQKDISILSAVIQEKKNQNQRHIVVKIGREDRTIEKEYNYGKELEKTKIPGFINYMCLFSCIDDTHLRGETPHEICKGKEDNPENHKKVLIMPYIMGGSIKYFDWNSNNFHILKSVLLQTLMSIFLAFHKVGFIHGDLHLDNILLKKTKKQEITYVLGDQTYSIPTNGYKIVIMDFDSSWMHVNKEEAIEFYWLDVYNMISRVNLDLSSKKGNRVIMNDNIKILNYIQNQRLKRADAKNTLKIMDMIGDFSWVENLLHNKLSYNPNIFG